MENINNRPSHRHQDTEESGRETDKGSHWKSDQSLQGSAEEMPSAQHIRIAGSCRHAGVGRGDG